MSAHVDQRDEEAQQSTCARATCGYELRAKQRKKECHHDVPENEPRKMAAKVRFRSPKHRNLLIRAMQELSVPDESKKEDETKRCDECDEEFFPIHNFFRLRLLL